MDRTDASARQHGDCKLGNHRHVDTDDVAFLDTQFFQSICESADLAMQFAIGESSLITRFSFEIDRDLFTQPSVKIGIQTVVGGIRHAIGKPFHKRFIPFQDLLKGLKPVKMFASFACPKAFEIRDRLVVQLLIRIHRADGSLFGKSLARRKQSRFDLNAINLARRCFRRHKFGFYWLWERKVDASR